MNRLLFPAILLLIISLATQSKNTDKSETEVLESHASVSMLQVSDAKNLKYPKTHTPRLKKYSYSSSFEVIRDTE